MPNKQKLDQTPWDEDELWFIVGIGHSGTNFLKEVLENHVDDPSTIKQQDGTAIDGYSVEEHGDQKSPHPDEEVIRQIRNERPRGKVEVSPPWTSFLPKAFPESNFATLYRNGKDVVRAHHTHHLNDDRTEQRDVSLFKWGCMRWVEHYEPVKEWEKNGREVLHIKFEELVQGNCVEELQQIVPSIEDYDTTPSNKTPDKRREQVKEPEQWSTEKKRMFNDICGEMMDYLGYETFDVENQFVIKE